MSAAGRPARTTAGGTDLLEGRWLILAALLAIAATCWVLIVRQAAGMAGADAPQAGTIGGSMAGMPMPSDVPAPLTAELDPPLFLAGWVVMMVAMMLPAAAPMILVFSKVQAGRRGRGEAAVSTWVFVAAYLLVWVAFGVVAYALASAVERLAGAVPELAAQAGRLGGLVLVAVGAYQLSPLKLACLTQCRTPTQFVLAAWRPGARGAFRMGVEHGAYCLGCCWLLFVALFPLGVMNLAAMVVVTALVFAEKVLPGGAGRARLAAWAIIAYGLLVVLMPSALPVAM